MQYRILNFVYVFILMNTLFSSAFLSYDLITQQKTTKILFNSLFTLVLPVPLLIYLIFLQPKKKEKTNTTEIKHRILSLLFFALSFCLSIFSILLYEKNYKVGFATTIAPIMLNSIILSAYTFNILVLGNIVFAGFLSGVAFAISLYIVLLT